MSGRTPDVSGRTKPEMDEQIEEDFGTVEVKKTRSWSLERGKEVQGVLKILLCLKCLRKEKWDLKVERGGIEVENRMYNEWVPSKLTGVRSRQKVYRW